MSRKTLGVGLLVVGVALGTGAMVLQGQTGMDGARLFGQVMQMVEQHAVDSLDNAAIYEKAARGLVKNLNDPYAELYSPEQLKSFQRNSLGNNYGGIGMQIQSQDGFITVTSVFPGTPGALGGVQAGDRIIMVDTATVTGFSTEEVSRRLTGPAGTRVSVGFARVGVDELIKTTFTRAIIRVPAVPFTLMLENGIGYLPLNRFNESAAGQFEEALLALRDQGATAYVIDLRGNPGGSLDQSLEIVNLFLRPGQEIASVRHRGRRPEVFRANRYSVVDSSRVVVLINQFSASASEIVAGALQDQDRGLVLGQSSFGKGLVQTLYPLDGGWAMKLTTGKWYTPSGRSIQGEHEQLADGRFVEYAPDSAETDSARRARPKFTSSGGRTVYGGGGVTPDVIIRQDTITTPEQELLRALGPRQATLYTTVYGYARELKGGVRPDFVVTPAWRDEVYGRLEKAEVTLDRALYDRAEPMITRMLEEQVASLAFGESAAARRRMNEDRQLQTALEYLRKGPTQRALLALAASSGQQQ